MNIGILGSGAVGLALATGFLNLGHTVMLASRQPQKEHLQQWLREATGNATAGTFAETATFADLAVLATNWTGAENALALADPHHLAGKVVIDATNPLDFSQGFPPRLAVGHTNSGGEEVQRWLPDARVVKAFNIIGLQHMVNPDFPEGPPDMFICGNDAAAKTQVSDILSAFGWGVIDGGDITASRYLEPLAMLWIRHAMATGTRDHAFKLLRK
jgi:predicted dinucleotide-binding enzyme